jgi:transforming growth factor-beta-induced protein
MKMKLLGLALMFVAGFSTAVRAEKNIVETAVGAGSFNTLAKAVTAADLAGALTGPGPFTVFAPTDEAFAKLPAGTLESLLKPENKGKLQAILKYHVVSGTVMAADVTKLKGAVSLNGQRIGVKAEGGKVMVDNATVAKTDIKCSNGVIHVIDSVILPSTDTIPAVAEKAGKFKTLLAAVKAAGLAETLSGEGPFTVFAPTDEAFAKIPAATLQDLLKPENKDKLTAILTYHVVPGRVFSEGALQAKSAKTVQGSNVNIKASDAGAFVENAKIVGTDVNSSNGVIHIIDTVIMPPAK